MSIRRSLVVVVILLTFVTGPTFGELVCDFNGDSTVNDSDLAVLIGWKQLVNAGIPSDQITTSVLLDVSKGILSSVTTVSRIPALSKDNLTDEALDAIDDEDLAYLIAYKQLENAGVTNFSFDTVKQVAKGILSTLARSMGKAPGVAIGDSNVPVTVTGIQLDP